MHEREIAFIESAGLIIQQSTLPLFLFVCYMVSAATREKKNEIEIYGVECVRVTRVSRAA